MLSYNLYQRQELGSSAIKRMYQLMEQNYNCVTEESFTYDLSNKELVGILSDADGIIQGFTTFAVNPANTGTYTYNILFSGDTIISPQYWGTQELAKGWCKTVGGLIAGDPDKKWYWFLMSKGHRTYMYLPLFFEKYFPASDNTEEDDLFPIVDRCARAMYGDCWKPKLGVISFDESHGELKQSCFKPAKKSRHVDFFLEKNPGFYKGDELTCMADLSIENFKRFTKSAILEGMQQPIIPRKYARS